METIQGHIRDIAASMVREADFLNNVKQTWEAVNGDFNKFVNSFRPILENIKKMGERYVSLKDIMNAVREGTGGSVVITPTLDLKRAR